MSAYVRSGVLMGTPELIRELGGAADELARRAGIDPLAFADPDFPVPLSTGIEFFESAANACACENFGLRLSQRQNLSLLGPLWTLARARPPWARCWMTWPVFSFCTPQACT